MLFKHSMYEYNIDIIYWYEYEYGSKHTYIKIKNIMYIYMKRILYFVFKYYLQIM